ncbi:2-hydroxyglutaryl-CoA dehydratase [Clostridium botulinum]|uniref:phenyllactyl-CoA dehydratase activase FldI n=1 Tax=Clostridium botulinum TaxID=1491 RepID=UPI000A178248|nr:phenyllactyl-CoA dehydratase activase FldI [Clostridium botulinum]AUN12277.1 2-hydroxyglutaryl-CoA dehydratase [Clostridium botulinum]AUN23267.1 2-hydroxyglutaryl-CoA dehydratase [Clostridium botulinum]AUN26968.1 2-hydroxyglutaryl-CoA dehydratase [Clostridium botulinum]OSA68261.1 2-hydroxyglutaryl-CoA dehydratase [Clostridium botulinum]QDY22727.1 2-hydroxyglutaryl-CoA dehydratase [Clostridium botulinum]
MADIYTMGVDIGSTASKTVVLKNGKEIVSQTVINVGAGTSGPKRAIDSVLREAKLSIEDLDYIVSTGYGRNSFEFANKQISELSCHAKGVYFDNNKARTVIDIGGQDIKVLKLADSGRLLNFIMNDKCAAGTGRFLDVMSRVIEIPVDELGKKALESKNPCTISSTCTVFAESEVISQLARGVKTEDLIAGICKSVASRVASLAKRNGIEELVVMSGGVAKNIGVVKAMEAELGKDIYISENSQLNGALGASLYAYESFQKERS